MKNLQRKITGQRIALLLMSVFLQASCLHAAGNEGAAFLDIPVGAGPAAMGSAYTALADNAYASVWNPGALGFVDTVQVAGQHLSYLESINDEYAGLALPVGPGKALGVSAQYLGSGDITQTNAAGETLGSFNAHYGAYSIAYGQKLGEKLGIGATGKWINAKLSNTSANAYAGDIGFLYKASEQWRLAGTLTNLGTKLTFIDQKDSLPSAFHLAAAYQPNHFWIVSAEALHEWPGDRFDGRAGLEWTPIDPMSLRTGYRSDTLNELSALAGFSVGMGLHFWGQEFAYAWVPYGDLGDTQYFSLLLKFGNSKKRQQNLQKASLDDGEYDQMVQLLSWSDVQIVSTPRGQP